ncbi:MAG: hypothetical protein IPO63_12735 [Bacteroidetes bacterium]|nr:hypothetical protein [Bacteroidota bacterium]
MSALFDIDKQLTNTPILWTIYDEFQQVLRKIVTPWTKPEEEPLFTIISIYLKLRIPITLKFYLSIN